MLDETTYYFTAFAIDQNNNIIVSETSSITTDFGWHVTPNTLAYWKLNNVTTVNDETGNHNLTLNGNVSYTANYVNLPGDSSGFFTASPFISASGSFTISLWCNFNEVSSQRQPIFQQFQSSTSNSAIAIWGTKNQWFIWGKGQGDWTVPGYTITVGQWYNVTLVYTPGTLKFYINGTLAGTYSRTIKTTTPDYFGIGKGWETNSPAYFNGKVGNIIVENIAWNQTTITEFFNKLKGKYGF